MQSECRNKCSTELRCSAGKHYASFCEAAFYDLQLVLFCKLLHKRHITLRCISVADGFGIYTKDNSYTKDFCRILLLLQHRGADRIPRIAIEKLNVRFHRKGNSRPSSDRDGLLNRFRYKYRCLARLLSEVS